jgi:hypothetical protein
MSPERFNPGDKIPKKEIYDVWGDIVLGLAQQGPHAIELINEFICNSALPKDFKYKTVQSLDDGHNFLNLEWDNLVAHIDACPIGNHLNVYVIVGLHRGLIESADPNERIANLEAYERRRLQVFQTLVRYAIEQTLDELDGGITQS